MIFRLISFAVLSFLFTQITKVQAQQIIPIYNSKNLKNNTLIIKSDSGNLNITAYKANVIKLTFFDKPTKAEKNTSVSSKEHLNIRVTQNLEDVFFATDSLWVIVNKFDLSVRFLKKHTEELLLKFDSYFLNNATKSVSFVLQNDEVLSFIDLKRQKKDSDLAGSLKALHRKKSTCKPLLVSKKGYALYFKNLSKKKVKINIEELGVKIKSPFTPNSFFFLSGGFVEMERNLKELKD